MFSITFWLFNGYVSSFMGASEVAEQIQLRYYFGGWSPA